jgi:hypothetical protein
LSLPLTHPPLSPLCLLSPSFPLFSLLPPLPPLPPTEQTDGLDANRHKVKTYNGGEEESAGSIFLIVLEAMVYTVGAIFMAAALYLLTRWYRGESVPFVGALNGELTESELEMQSMQRIPVTPDSFRT